MAKKHDKMKKKKKKKQMQIHSFQKWKFGTINIRSGKEKDEGAKIYAVAKEVARAGLMFCCLQEVKYRNMGSKLIQLDTGEKFELHWCGQKRRREAGVGILIRVHPDVEINAPDVNEPRIMAMDIKVYRFNLRIVNGYSPTDSGGSDNQKQVFYQQLKKACAKNQKHQKLIVVGDFNAITSVVNYMSCYDGKKVVQDSNCSDNGGRLKSFCRSHKLCISSTFFKHRMLHRYTWYSPDKKTRKVNDYTLTEKYVQQYVTDCRVRRQYNFDSDHRLLITSMRTPCTRKARRRYNKLPEKPKRDIKALRNPIIQKKYVDTVNTGFRNSVHQKHPNEASKRVIDILSSAANNVLPEKPKTEKECELWKNDSLLNKLLAERAKAPSESSSYSIVTKMIKKRVSWLRNEKLREEAEEINEHASKREIEELFRSMKSDRSAFKNTRSKNSCDTEKLKQYFMSHFNHEIPSDEPVELVDIPVFIKKLQNVSINGIKTSSPDKDELRKVLKKLKNGKAANDIPAEFLKYAESSDEFINEMHSLFTSIWTTHAMPTTWGHTKLAALWKGASKGSVKDPAAYRGLQIGSTLCKILVIIIIDRLKTWYDTQLLDQQQGFRSGRGTADGIFTTKRIQQITDKMRKPVFLLFVDLSAAFDHVVRDWMFKSIYQRFPPHADTTLIQLLESLYRYTTTSLAETPDDLFELLLGVRQGGPESPPLFNLYLDYVMRVFTDLCKKRGIKFLKLEYRIRSTATTRDERNNKTHQGNQTVDWTGYADDLKLFFEDSVNLQKGLEALHETFLRYHLTINVEKTKTMIVNYRYINNDSSTYPDSIATLDNNPIENVMMFRYLGDEIKYDEPSTGDAEIELRIDIAEGKFYERSKKLLNHRILLQTRIKILNSIVRSRLTYSCQTWNLTERQTNRVNSAYTSMLRKMVKGGYRRKKETEFHFVLSNSDLHSICQTEDVSEFTKRQQRKYLAHLARQPNSTLTKQLLFNSNKTTKRGKQSTLESTVLCDEQCSADEFYKKALKREY